MRKSKGGRVEVPSEGDKDWVKENGPNIAVFWLADTRLHFSTWLATEAHQYYDKMAEFEAATLRCLSAKDLKYIAESKKILPLNHRSRCLAKLDLLASVLVSSTNIFSLVHGRESVPPNNALVQLFNEESSFLEAVTDQYQAYKNLERLVAKKDREQVTPVDMVSEHPEQTRSESVALSNADLNADLSANLVLDYFIELIDPENTEAFSQWLSANPSSQEQILEFSAGMKFILDDEGYEAFVNMALQGDAKLLEQYFLENRVLATYIYDNNHLLHQVVQPFRLALPELLAATEAADFRSGEVRPELQESFNQASEIEPLHVAVASFQDSSNAQYENRAAKLLLLIEKLENVEGPISSKQIIQTLGLADWINGMDPKTKKEMNVDQMITRIATFVTDYRQQPVEKVLEKADNLLLAKGWSHQDIQNIETMYTLYAVQNQQMMPVEGFVIKDLFTPAAVLLDSLTVPHHALRQGLYGDTVVEQVEKPVSESQSKPPYQRAAIPLSAQRDKRRIVSHFFKEKSYHHAFDRDLSVCQRQVDVLSTLLAILRKNTDQPERVPGFHALSRLERPRLNVSPSSADRIDQFYQIAREVTAYHVNKMEENLYDLVVTYHKNNFFSGCGAQALATWLGEQPTDEMEKLLHFFNQPLKHHELAAFVRSEIGSKAIGHADEMKMLDQLFSAESALLRSVVAKREEMTQQVGVLKTLVRQDMLGHEDIDALISKLPVSQTSFADAFALEEQLSGIEQQLDVVLETRALLADQLQGYLETVSPDDWPERDQFISLVDGMSCSHEASRSDKLAALTNLQPVRAFILDGLQQADPATNNIPSDIARLLKIDSASAKLAVNNPGKGN